MKMCPLVFMSLFLLFSHGCRTSHKATPEPTVVQKAPPSLPKVVGSNLLIKIGAQSEQVPLSEGGNTATALEFVNLIDIDKFTAAKLDIVEFDGKGQLNSIIATRESIPECFSFGIVSYAVNHYTFKPILITAYHQDTLASTPLAPLMAQYQFCKSGEITAHNSADALTLKQFLLGRGRLSAGEGETLNLLGGSKVLRSTSLRSETPPNGPPVTRSLDSNPSSQNSGKDFLNTSEPFKKIESRNSLDSLSPEEIALTPKTAFSDLDDLRRLELHEQGSLNGNNLEKDFFENLVRDNKIEYLEQLGKGSFATVNRIKIGGEEFALREENLSSLSPYKIAAKREERFNFLVQNRFADLHPGLPFMRTFSSFVDEKTGKYISILPLASGGDMKNAIKKITDDGIRESWMLDISKQLQAYRQGIPMKIGGEEYTLEFQHADLKPENFMMGADGRPSIVDFGFSKAMLRKTEANGSVTYKMLDFSGASPAVKDLALNRNEMGRVHRAYGTPLYLTREMFDKNKLDTPEEVYNFLRDNDAHAFNAISYELAQNDHYLGRVFSQNVQWQNIVKQLKIKKVEDISAYLSFETGGISRTSRLGARPLLPWATIKGDGTDELIRTGKAGLSVQTAAR